MHFKSPTIADLAEKLITLGERSSPRDQPTRELIGVSMEYRMGTFPYRKGMSIRLAEMEAAQMVAGVFDKEAIARAAPNAELSLFTDQSAYGPILAKQLPRVVHTLGKDPSTRRAVLYLGSTKTQLTDDVPCTNSLQLLVRSGMLHLIVSMRSWDVVYGLPNDLASFNLVAQAVAANLGLLDGRVYVMAGSLHLYDRTAHKAVPGPFPFGRTSVSPRITDWKAVIETAGRQVRGETDWLRAIYGPAASTEVPLERAGAS